MRNLKKVLSLVLCAAMMLSVMVMSTGAVFADQNKITHTEAVDACVSLKIIDGKENNQFDPAGNVTRAEMCKMICVALNGGKAPQFGTTDKTSFTDTKGHWAAAYIEACFTQGIVSGVGDNKFEPEASVTPAQAAKMLLVALGYKSENEGFTGETWAVKVNIAAAAKHLYDQLVNVATDKAMNRDNAAQMIWNALNANVVEYKSDLVNVGGQWGTQVTLQDKVVGNTSDKITLLEDKYEAKTFQGTFTGNTDTLSLDKDQMQVKGTNTATDKEVSANFKFDLDLQYIGEDVKVLYKDSTTAGTKGQPDTKDTIYGVFVTGETTVYNITKNDLQTTSTEGKIKFGGKEYKLATPALAADAFVNLNYITVTDASAATVAAAKTLFDGLKAVSPDTIKFICNDKGEITSAYVVASKLARVTAVNSEKVSINNSVGTMKTADNDVYSGIAKDDIVVVTTFFNSTVSNDASYSIVTKAETVEGKITAYNGTKTLSIDGTSYDIANDNTLVGTAVDSDFVTSFANQIGETVKAYVYGGMVYAAEMVTEANQYAVIEDSTGLMGSSFDPLKAKVMKSDGTEVTVEIHKDSIKPTVGSTATDLVAHDNNTTYAANELSVGAVIKYSDVSNGKIKVTKITQPTYETNASSSGADLIYDKDTKSFKGTVTDSAAVVFVKKGSDFYRYTARNLSDITIAAGTDYNYTVAMNDDNTKVVAAYVTLTTKPSGSSASTTYGIVSAENGITKVNDDTYTSWTVQVDDNRDNDKIVMIEGSSSHLTKGDLVAFDVTSDNTYSAGDVTIYYNDPAFSVASNALDVFVKEYDEGGKILSYYAGTNGSDPTTGTLITKALDDKIQIVYFDGDDNIGAASVGVNEFDAVTNKKNAVVVFKDNDPTKAIVAIYVDVDNDIAR